MIRLEILLKHIFLNKHCVTDLTLSRQKDVSDALKSLVREEYISEKEYDALSKEDDPNLGKVISEIKTTKIGCGINFLPRKTPDLLTKLKDWVMNFAENGAAALQQKTLAVLDCLLFRKVIPRQEHKDIAP